MLLPIFWYRFGYYSPRQIPKPMLQSIFQTQIPFSFILGGNNNFNHLNLQKMSASELKTKYTKMSSEALLRKAMYGGKMTLKEAKAAATIIERRFPTPQGIR